MRCPSCGGASHPATGSVLPSGEVVCGPCVRRFWGWASEHGKKTYRVGKRGKGSKYIAFPTGITKKNAKRRTTKRRRSSPPIPLIRLFDDGFSLRYVPGRRIWEAWLMPDDIGKHRVTVGTTAMEAADALMMQEGRKLEPWNFIGREAYETGRLIDLGLGIDSPNVITNRRRRTSRRRTSRR